MRYKDFIKKLCIIIYVLSSPLLLAGCWGYSELNDTGIVLATAIDLVGENQYEATVISIAPIGTGGGMQQPDRSNAWIGTARGASPDEAIKNLRMMATKNIIWNHNDIFIIGEAMAREGISGLIDFLVRESEIRLNNSIMIAEGRASDIFKVPADIENDLHSEIKGIISNSEKWSKGYVPDLRKFLQEYTLAHIGAVAGRIGYMEQNISSFSTNREKYLQFPNPEKRQTTIIIAGCAAFKKDKLAGFLNEVETSGYSWITEKAEPGTLILADLGGGKTSAMELQVVRSGIEPEIKDGNISMKLKVEITGRLAEDERFINLDSEVIAGLEADFGEEVTKEMETAVKKAQKELKADIFGFGDALYRKKPEIWRMVQPEWEEMFPDIEIQPEVKVTLWRVGQTHGKVSPEEID